MDSHSSTWYSQNVRGRGSARRLSVNQEMPIVVDKAAIERRMSVKPSTYPIFRETTDPSLSEPVLNIAALGMYVCLIVMSQANKQIQRGQNNEKNCTETVGQTMKREPKQCSQCRKTNHEKRAKPVQQNCTEGCTNHEKSQDNAAKLDTRKIGSFQRLAKLDTSHTRKIGKPSIPKIGMPHPRNIGMARSPKIGRLSDPRKI
jgi:hypothetical protein